jgi:hypothetical protein
MWPLPTAWEIEAEAQNQMLHRDRGFFLGRLFLFLCPFVISHLDGSPSLPFYFVFLFIPFFFFPFFAFFSPGF